MEKEPLAKSARAAKEKTEDTAQPPCVHSPLAGSCQPASPLCVLSGLGVSHHRTRSQAQTTPIRVHSCPLVVQIPRFAAPASRQISVNRAKSRLIALNRASAAGGWCPAHNLNLKPNLTTTSMLLLNHQNRVGLPGCRHLRLPVQIKRSQTLAKLSL